MIINNLRTDCFIIKGQANNTYATNLETRKSMSGLEVTLNRAPIVMRSTGQKIVTLFITEAKLIADMEYIQEILHMMRLLESMGLKVQKPMVLESNNKGALDL